MSVERAPHQAGRVGWEASACWRGAASRPTLAPHPPHTRPTVGRAGGITGKFLKNPVWFVSFFAISVLELGRLDVHDLKFWLHNNDYEDNIETLAFGFRVQ